MSSVNLNILHNARILQTDKCLAPIP